MVVGTFRKCMKKAKWKHNETGLQVAHLDVVPDLWKNQAHGTKRIYFPDVQEDDGGTGSSVRKNTLKLKMITLVYTLLVVF